MGSTVCLCKMVYVNGPFLKVVGLPASLNTLTKTSFVRRLPLLIGIIEAASLGYLPLLTINISDVPNINKGSFTIDKGFKIQYQLDQAFYAFQIFETIKTINAQIKCMQIYRLCVLSNVARNYYKLNKPDKIGRAHVFHVYLLSCVFIVYSHNMIKLASQV